MWLRKPFSSWCKTCTRSNLTPTQHTGHRWFRFGLRDLVWLAATSSLALELGLQAARRNCEIEVLRDTGEIMADMLRSDLLSKSNAIQELQLRLDASEEGRGELLLKIEAMRREAAK